MFHSNHFYFTSAYKRAFKLFCLFLLSFVVAKGQEVIHLSNSRQQVLLAGNYSYYISSSADSKSEIQQQKFILDKDNSPFYKLNVSNVWLRFIVANETDNPDFYFDLRYSNLSKITLYKEQDKDLILLNSQGNEVKRKYDLNLGPNFIFPINQAIKTQQEYLLHIESSHPIIIPAYVCTEATVQKNSLTQFIVAALFTGVLAVMIIYNLFLFFVIRDNSYAIYVLYTFSLLLAVLTADGYLARYIWPNHTELNLYAVIVTSNLPIIIGIVFAINFLQIRNYAPSILWIFIVIVITSFIDIIIGFFHLINLSYLILSYNGLVTGLLLFFTSLYIGRKGYKPAYLYLIGWISILVARILLSLRNMDVLPYNGLLSHIVYIGAALETAMLSFALADKINMYKKEKEISQAEALYVSKEKEKLIKDQNLNLEKQVKQRTAELEKTLRNLKDTQVQLVESEKMSSLGQLTAGIAHEINNPINFVKSNVSPLQMDVQDLFQLITEYQQLHGVNAEDLLPKLDSIKTLETKLDPDFLKEEIENLIGGIEEGAERTAEIVRGLRNFSRLDESEVKEVSIYDNINSTLVLLRNATPHYLKIRKHYDAPGQIECYPGKLNQVFMNILTNGIHAIKSKPVKNDEEYIDVFVNKVDGCMQIKISDTGTGMTEKVKRKIFDPFFTTKDVGEGTGLGMSIVFKIIEKHHGKISVNSAPGEGATFIIDIPYMLKKVSALAEEQEQLFTEQTTQSL